MRKSILEVHWGVNSFRIKVFCAIQTVAGNLGLILDISKYCAFLAAVVLSSHLCVHQNSGYMPGSSCSIFDVCYKKRSQNKEIVVLIFPQSSEAKDLSQL